MDLAAPLKPEVLRPIVTLVVPGTIATGPYVLLLGGYVSAVETFWTAHTTAFTILLVLAVLAAGFILDDSGTVIEKYWIDPWLKGKRTTHDADWEKYLKLQLQDELVGQRYLRNKFTQLKFELSLGQALVIFWFGLLWLQILRDVWSWKGFLLASLLVLGGAIALLVGSRFTACVLSETRALILAAIDEGPRGIVSSTKGPANSA